MKMQITIIIIMIIMMVVIICVIIISFYVEANVVSCGFVSKAESGRPTADTSSGHTVSVVRGSDSVQPRPHSQYLFCTN